MCSLLNINGSICSCRMELIIATKINMACLKYCMKEIIFLLFRKTKILVIGVTHWISDCIQPLIQDRKYPFNLNYQLEGIIFCTLLRVLIKNSSASISYVIQKEELNELIFCWCMKEGGESRKKLLYEGVHRRESWFDLCQNLKSCGIQANS